VGTENVKLLIILPILQFLPPPSLSLSYVQTNTNYVITDGVPFSGNVVILYRRFVNIIQSEFIMAALDLPSAFLFSVYSIIRKVILPLCLLLYGGVEVQVYAFLTSAPERGVSSA
jgi:hypothetical protein